MLGSKEIAKWPNYCVVSVQKCKNYFKENAHFMESSDFSWECSKTQYYKGKDS